MDTSGRNPLHLERGTSDVEMPEYSSVRRESADLGDDRDHGDEGEHLDHVSDITENFVRERRRSVDSNPNVARSPSLDRSMSKRLVDDIEKPHKAIIDDHAVLKDIENRDDASLPELWQFDQFNDPTNCLGNMFGETFLGILYEKLWPRIRTRIWNYLMVLILLSLVIFGQADKHRSLYGVMPRHWYAFALAVIVIEFGMTLMDELFFIFFDKYWCGSFDKAYFAHALNGPLGMILTVFFVNQYLSDMDAPQALSNWHPLMSSIVVVLICFTVKNYSQRVSYTKLIETRFTDRLQQLELWRLILSRLACTKPPKQHRGAPPITSTFKRKFIDDDHASSTVSGNSPRSSTTSKFSIKNVDKSKIANLFRRRSLHINEEQKVKDVFEEIVNASTLKYGHREDENEDDVLREQQMSFWRRMKSLQSGLLVLSTYNGFVKIRRKKHAKSFGRRLYYHLSNGGQRKVTADMLTTILKTGRGVTEHEDIENTVKVGLALFNIVNSDDIPEERVVNAVVNVYKDLRFASSSLNNFGELHQSLRKVIDVFFWLLMFMIVQVILQFDMTTVLAPLLTILFGISFALGPVFGNLFCSITFVLFMLPYDVGHRIIVGYGSSSLKCNVISISLWYTTVITIYNEKIRIPNHTLFNEKIHNYYESANPVFELVVEFNIAGGEGSNQAKIDQFWKIMKSYIVEEQHEHWEGVFVLCNGLDYKNNSKSYGMWATHRMTWQDTVEIFTARTQAYEKMTQVQDELGIRFMKITQPVEFVNNPPPVTNATYGKARSGTEEYLGSSPLPRKGSY